MPISTASPATQRCTVRLRAVTTATSMLSAISTAALTRPPNTEVSPPFSALDTASLSSITTSRSKGVNWPTVRRPETRIKSSSAAYTTAPRTGNSHQAVCKDHIAASP